MLALFVIIATGLLIGQVRLGGLSLGSSGVIFTALAAGHLGFTVPGGLGSLGLILFIYAVGLAAGPSFFRVFRQHGRTLAQLSILLVVTGAATTWAMARLMDIPVELAAGLFAGALTSTPGLAAVLEGFGASSQVAVGYGIAYPVGVVGVVLFVQLLPRVMRLDLDQLDRKIKAADPRDRTISRVLVEVVNPAVFGQRLDSLEMIAASNCQVTRVLDGDRLIPVERGFMLEKGQHVLVVGRVFRLDPIVTLLGKKSTRTDYVLDTDRHRSTVVATANAVVGHAIGDLRLLATFGVTISRIARHDVEFVPDLDDVIQWGDALQVIGSPEALVKFKEHAGHRQSAFDQTDLVSVALGIAVGVGAGMISFGWGDANIALGMVGGPLLVALVAGHFGRVGRIYASLPRASRLLMMELGLVLFLAEAGAHAGVDLFPVLQQYGWELILAAFAVVSVPILVGALFAMKGLDLNVLQMLGGVCGGMTSTPGLGALTGKTESEIPVSAYAAAYPVALILMTVIGKLLVALL